MNSDLDIWWSAYLATLANSETINPDIAYQVADTSLDDYKRTAAELKEIANG